MHIPFAEFGNVDVLLTTDYVLLKKYERLQDVVKVKLDNPLSWISEEL